MTPRTPRTPRTSGSIARIALSCAVALGCVATASVAHAQVPIPPPPALSHAPGDGPHVDAYVGMEFVTLSRLVGGTNFEQFDVRGISRQPYILKVADIRLTGLGRFEAGLNAAATSIVALGGFTSESQTSTADLGQAERYAGMLGYVLGKHVTLRGEASYAHLVTYAAPNFHRTGDVSLTTYSVPENGAPLRLHPGATIPGNTDWYSLAVTATIDGEAVGAKWFKDMIFGYRLVRISTLSAYLASSGDTVSSVIQAIAQDTFQCHAASFRSNFNYDLFDDLHLSGFIYGFLGYSSVSSAFVDTSGGVCVGRGLQAALTYTQPHWSFVIGYNYEEVSAIQVGGGNTMSNTLTYSDWRTGRVGVARAGSQWNVSTTAESFQVLGPFTRLTISY